MTAREPPRGEPRAARPAAAAARGPSPRRRGPAGSRRSPRDAARPSHARARSSTADQFACPAGRAPECRRWWSTARAEEGRLSDGQPFPPLRAPALDHFPPALGLHPLAESVRLLPPPHVRLERPLHERGSPPYNRRIATV